MTIADLVRWGWTYDPVRDQGQAGSILVSGELIRRDGWESLAPLFTLPQRDDFDAVEDGE